MTTNSTVAGPPAVFQAISEVAAALAREGITKERRNQQQGFFFRGIDDVYHALSPLLAKHHLVILPHVEERIETVREAKSGGSLYSVVLRVRYMLYCATDGSSTSTLVWGEAMDSGDKATNKALSAAYKYMAFQVFCIPVDGQDDADAETPPPSRPATQPAPPQPQAPAAPPEPAAAKKAKTPAKTAPASNSATAAVPAPDLTSVLKAIQGAYSEPELLSVGAMASHLPEKDKPVAKKAYAIRRAEIQLRQALLDKISPAMKDDHKVAALVDFCGAELGIALTSKRELATLDTPDLERIVKWLGSMPEQEVSHP